MTQVEKRDIRKAWASIGGFACNQGFLFALFYLGARSSLSLAGAAVERIDLMGLLACMLACMVALHRLSPKLRDIALSCKFAWGYALLLVICSLAPEILGGGFILPIAFEAVFVGVPAALLMCAWGRALGMMPVERSVPTVFIATAAAAALCLFVTSLPIDWAHLVLYLLPLGSASFLRETQREVIPTADFASVKHPVVEGSADRFSGKVLLGTLLYGLATGLVETLSVAPASRSTPAFAITFFLLVAFCLASLQLFRGVKVARLRAFFGESDAGPLDSAYRLAFMVLTAGFLLVPVLNAFGVVGESIVLAGYLGMNTVLISVFIIVGRLRARDTALAFAEGFSALFAGEFIGLILGNLGHLDPFSAASDLGVAFAGLLALYAYLFLFTDRDVSELTVVVGEVDCFEEACRRIVEKHALSKREAEILPLALRGRTSERIGQELFISKNTVDTHLRRIYAKCEVGSRQELIDLGEKVQEELR